MARENKRKLYVTDFTVRDEFDWTKVKRHKRSCFSFHQQTTIGDEDLEGLFQTYSKTKRTVDNVSDDILMAIVPGPLADEPENPNLQNVCKLMKKLTPKHQKPRIGRIDVAHQDAMRWSRKTASFNSSRGEDHLVFTTERKGSMPPVALKANLD